MQQNIKYERNEEYIPPQRDDIQVKNLTSYKDEKSEVTISFTQCRVLIVDSEQNEDSDKEKDEVDAEEEDDILAAKRQAELEKLKELEKEAVKQPIQKEAKVELIAKPQPIMTEEVKTSELRLLTADYLDTVDMKAFLTRYWSANTVLLIHT